MVSLAVVDINSSFIILTRFSSVFVYTTGIEHQYSQKHQCCSMYRDSSSVAFCWFAYIINNYTFTFLTIKNHLRLSIHRKFNTFLFNVSFHQMRNWQKKYMGFMMENHLYFAIYKVLSTFSTFSSILMQCKFHVNIWMCLLTRCNRRDQIFRLNKIVKYFFYVLIWIHVVWT